MDFGPCEPWPVRWSNCERLVDLGSPAVTGDAVAAATHVLWARSGRQFGLCTTTLRPCRRDCYDQMPYGWVEWPGPYGMAAGTPAWPALVGGAWYNLACGSCSGSCSCSALSEVLLPGVVHDIVAVRLDGSPMASGGYRVDNNRVLVRVDGGTWPWCNDLAKPDSSPGTWSVTARYGQDPPILAQLAVGELACQFLDAFAGEQCQLPRSLTSLVRQGVSIELPRPGDVEAEGRLGLYQCDLFIDTVNPGHLPGPSRVYSVDRSPPRRVGT
jgi:hypothetical protein